MRKLRIEQLSAESGFSVSTIRYYQFHKILQSPKKEGRIAVYSTSHIKRLKEIQRLQDGGFSLQQIQSLKDEELKNKSPNSRESLLGALKEGSPVTYEDLLVKSGISSEILDLAIQHKLVVPIPGSKNLYYRQSVEMLAAAADLIALGIDLGALLDLALKHAGDIENTAKAAVKIFAKIFAESAETEEKKLLEKIQNLIPQTVSLVALHFHQALLANSVKYISKKKTSGKAS